MPQKPVTQRKVSMRTLTRMLAGPERPYPVYNFGPRQKFERPEGNTYS